MRKILRGLSAIIVVAAGGTFALSAWAQREAETGVDAALSAARAAGGSVTRGKVEADPLRGRVSVTEVAVKPDAASPLTFKVGRVTVEGASLSTAGMLSAERIEIDDFEITGNTQMPTGMRVSYAGPRLEIVGYSGPITPLGSGANASGTDLMRVLLERLSAISATSVSIPRLTLTMTPPAGGPSPLGAINATYANIGLRDIRDGRIGQTTTERVTLRMAMPPELGAGASLNGTIEKIAIADFDSSAILAILDPARAKEDRYLPVEGRVTMGAYSISLPNGGSMRIDGATVEDVAVRPSKFALADLMKAMENAPKPGEPPSPTQVRDMLELVASMYEGIRLGRFEMRGMSTNVPPDGAVRLGAFRLSNLENGRLAEFAIEGLEAMTPQKEAVRIGRFALKGLDIASLMRMSAQFSTQPPEPDQLIALLALLEGTEIRDVVAPYKSGGTVNVDVIAASWGKFIGTIPSAARLTAKITGPIDIADPDLFQMLASAGLNTATVSLDVGAGWNEPTRTFTVEPIELEVANLLSTTMKITVQNVTREVFSGDPLRMTLATTFIEAGPIEFTFTDQGALDLNLAQMSRSQGVSREQARRMIVDGARKMAQDMAPTNPDALAVASAVADFVSAPRRTLVVKLTPKSRLRVMHAIEVAKDDPTELLSQFRIEASVRGPAGAPPSVPAQPR